MSSLVEKKGFSYAFDPSACEDCGGKCCIGKSGSIRIFRGDIAKISSYLEVDTDTLMKLYVFKSGYRYLIKEVRRGDSYECIFFDTVSKGCKIYGARPLQCSSFPFWDYYRDRVDELKQECVGVIDV